MILVLGATGSTGGEVARQLIAAGVTPRLFVRNRSKAAEFEGKADIREGDIKEESTFRSALAGIEKLYLVRTVWRDAILRKERLMLQQMPVFVTW
jgi:uncharacterized protein YbjT (DUF2867 family)